MPRRLPPSIPALFPAHGEVEDRFQSYNVEMIEVIGGRFWKPYAGKAEGAEGQSPVARTSDVPVGMDPDIYQYRPPIDLGNARLRTLAAALGPAYVRVSGTWANTFISMIGHSPAVRAAGRVRRRADPAAMERSRRFRRSGRRADRDLVRYRSRYPGRERRLETGSGAGAARLHPFALGGDDRRDRVHE